MKKKKRTRDSHIAIIMLGFLIFLFLLTDPPPHSAHIFFDPLLNLKEQIPWNDGMANPICSTLFQYFFHSIVHYFIRIPFFPTQHTSHSAHLLLLLPFIHLLCPLLYLSRRNMSCGPIIHEYCPLKLLAVLPVMLTLSICSHLTSVFLFHSIHV